MVLSAEQDSSADISASGIAAKINALSSLVKQALQSLMQEGAVTWEMDHFAVIGINQNKLPKNQYNIRIRCDAYTKSQKDAWGGRFKQLITEQSLAILKCDAIWIDLVVMEIPKNGVMPVDPGLPALEFAARLAEFNQRMREQQQEAVDYLTSIGRKATLDDFPDSGQITQQLLDAVAPSTFTQIGVPVDPKDKQRICGMRTTRCPNCTCLHDKSHPPHYR